MPVESFKIVFQKLDEVLREEGLASDGGFKITEVDPDELNEIGELKRFILEVDDPDPWSYTLT